MQQVHDDGERTGQTGQREQGHMPTIALVDDDRNILTSVSITLEAEGYRRAHLYRWGCGTGGPVGQPAGHCCL